MPPQVFYNGKVDYFDQQRLGGLLSHLRKTLKGAGAGAGRSPAGRTPCVPSRLCPLEGARGPAVVLPAVPARSTQGASEPCHEAGRVLTGGGPGVWGGPEVELLPGLF